ncbi:MAG: FecR domain-containing protein [Gammaproteobacteria bacterium]|nr:FecR domain-containing protein [Gammaproteobacteria bacterium]
MNHNNISSSILMFFLFFLLSNTVCSSTEMVEGEKVGSLRNVVGEGYVQRAGESEQIKAVDGLEVFQNDTISTKNDTSLGLVFKDSTRISLGANSKLTITKYVFNPSKKKFSMLTRLSKGSLSYVSGKLSKLAPNSVSFETPDATIGSRGTSFIIKVDE